MPLALPDLGLSNFITSPKAKSKNYEKFFSSGGGREQLLFGADRYKNVMMKVEGTNCNSCVAKFVIFHSETKELKFARTGDETDNDPTNYGARCQSTPRFARAKNTKTEEICQRVANYKFWS